VEAQKRLERKSASPIAHLRIGSVSSAKKPSAARVRWRFGSPVGEAVG